MANILKLFIAGNILTKVISTRFNSTTNINFQNQQLPIEIFGSCQRGGVTKVASVLRLTAFL